MATPLDDLLARLGTGDDAAAEEVFRAYEPYLRLVVRRLLPDPLRTKFDSCDVVQSVWADLLRGFRTRGWRFTSAGQLRAFLVKVTRNRFLDRARKYRRVIEHEQALQSTVVAGTTSREPPPAEVAHAEDVWRQLLAGVSPLHRDVLRLKREGLAPDEIAARTGLHPGSVRRILYGLARAFAERQAPAGGAARE